MVVAPVWPNGVTVAKIERMLGWVPEVGIEEGLRRLIDWRKTQPA